MSRNQRLDEILRAQLEFREAPLDSRAEKRRQLDRLIDQALEGKHTTRFELMAALRDRFREYRKAQDSEQRRKSSV